MNVFFFFLESNWTNFITKFQIKIRSSRPHSATIIIIIIIMIFKYILNTYIYSAAMAPGSENKILMDKVIKNWTVTAPVTSLYNYHYNNNQNYYCYYYNIIMIRLSSGDKCSWSNDKRNNQHSSEQKAFSVQCAVRSDVVYCVYQDVQAAVNLLRSLWLWLRQQITNFKRKFLRFFPFVRHLIQFTCKFPVHIGKCLKMIF